MARPSTSKPRGVCRFYQTQHGCFAGSACKFLHADPLLTPYDQSKRCRFYAQGFCRRGDQCWFKHTLDAPPAPPQDDRQNDPCSICFEMPVTYGLLSGCSHIFCITCIRQWRDQKGGIEQNIIKRCPMCREPSRFITPSSHFYQHGHPEKERITQAYKESMARVPCRYFQRSLQQDEAHPLCPFGKDCFYQHLKADGAPFVFDHGAEICMRRYHNSFPSHPRFDYDVTHLIPSDWVPLTVDVLQEAMETLESAVSTSSETMTHTLNVVRLLVNRDVVNNNPEQVETFTHNERQDDHPMTSDDSEGIDPESDSDDEISQLGRYIRSTRVDIEDEHPGEEHNADNADNDNPPVAVEERESRRVANPPFQTDGRGRVVWSGLANTSDVVDDESRTAEDQETIECSGRNKSNTV